MKKIFTLLAAFMVVLSTAQTTPSFKTIKLTGTTAGGTNDSVLTIGTDNVVKKVAKSVITDGLATASQLDAKENTITAGTTSQYFRGDKTWQTLNTSVVPESGNLYFTNARARTALSFTGGGANYNATTGVITIPTATNQLINNSGFITGLTFAAVTDKPTTLSGYGITDAQSFIAPGTTSQYWRGDKTWQTLDKTAVGLSNVDNTSDAAKPISTATQTALNLKANIASPTFTGTVSGITKAMVGLGNVDNTSDANKPISTATQTALNAKQNTLVSGTSIKTINGNSLLGSGNIVISSGGSTAPLEFNTTDLTVWNNGKGNIASNTSFGESALAANTTGTQNNAFGQGSLLQNSSGIGNTSIGNFALQTNTTGGTNTAIGYLAGGKIGDGTFVNPANNSNDSVFIGTYAFPLNDNQTNQIVIGAFANGAGSNTVTLGNTSIVKTVLRGTINTDSIPVFADNAAATAGGLLVGDQYRTSTGVLMVRF